MSALVVATALGSTCFASVSTALKHRTATTAAQKPEGRARALLAAATRPLWLAALGLDSIALLLQITALHLGQLALVQPLLVTALIFSLLVHHRIERTPVLLQEVRYAAQLIASLVAFLLVSGAASSTTLVALPPPDRSVAVLAGAVAVSIAAAVISLSRFRPSYRASLLAVAVAVDYAATAALIKTCTNIAAKSPTALLTSWELYAAVSCALLGLIGAQRAFGAGPLTASLPIIAALDPVLSVALGVTVFDEPLRSGPLATLLDVATLTALACSAFALARLESTALDTPPEPVATAQRGHANH